MNFNLDKKTEHERLAEEALVVRDFSKAYFHVIEAIKHTVSLAGRCSGVLHAAYVSNADQLIDVAEKIKKKLDAKPPVAASAAGDASQPIAEKVTGEKGGADAPAPTTVQYDTGVRFDDVKGLEEAKAVVRKSLINPVKYPQIYKTYDIPSGNGLLLYGPPGTGKTMFARAIAGELGIPFIYRKASELKDKYVGDSEKNMANLFKEAHAYPQSIVFIDECDDLLCVRGNQKVKIVNTFLTEMGGFEENGASRAFFLLATNKPWMIDEAVFSRIGAAVHVGLPEPVARRFIIEDALKDKDVAEDVQIDELVDWTDGFSGRELNGYGVGLCFVAKANAAERWVQRVEASENKEAELQVPEKITKQDFLTALAGIKPISKLRPESVKRNLAWSLDHRSSDQASDGEAE